MSYHFADNSSLRNSKPSRIKQPKNENTATPLKNGEIKMLGTLFAGNLSGFTSLSKDEKRDIRENARTGEITSKVSVDSRGKERFHGAFSGGFSAGYFNTVGSKEGWTPSTFRSSKDNKNDLKMKKPEDLMDWEDREDAMEIGQSIVTRDQFDNFSSNASFVVPSGESIGIKLLKRMGWKEGSAIGAEMSVPKLDAPVTKNKKSYGAALPPGFFKEVKKVEQSPLEMGEAAFMAYLKRVSKAPTTVPVYEADLSQTGHGIGYDPSTDFSRTTLKKLGTSVDKKKPLLDKMKASSMGLGYDDDPDISIEDYSNNMSLDYETEIVDNKTDYNSNNQLSIISQTEARFVLGSRASLPPVRFVAPQVPKDFSPFHVFQSNDINIAVQARPKIDKIIAEINKSLADKNLPTSFGSKPVDPVAIAMPKNNTNYVVKSSSQRGQLLGELPLPSAPKVDIKVESDQPISNQNFQLSSILSKQFVLGEIQGSSSLVKPGISYLSKDDSDEFALQNVSSSSMKSKFLSQFAGDLSKTGRLSDFFEELQNNHLSRLKSLSLKNILDIVPVVNKISAYSQHMTEWQRKQEEIEFKDLFENSQFGKSLIKEWDSEYFRLSEEVKQEVHHQKLQEQMESSGSKDFISAAKLKMFGKLTRHIEDFKPDKLLLRRLNIVDPFEHRNFIPDTTLQSLSKDNSNKFENRMAGLLEDVGLTTPKLPDKIEFNPPDFSVRETLQLEAKETIVEKPSMDLFKAIFDDEEDDDISAPILLMKNPYEYQELNSIEVNKLNTNNFVGNNSSSISKATVSSETIDFLTNVLNPIDQDDALSTSLEQKHSNPFIISSSKSTDLIPKNNNLIKASYTNYDEDFASTPISKVIFNENTSLPNEITKHNHSKSSESELSEKSGKHHDKKKKEKKREEKRKEEKKKRKLDKILEKII